MSQKHKTTELLVSVGRVIKGNKGMVGFSFSVLYS